MRQKPSRGHEKYCSVSLVAHLTLPGRPMSNSKSRQISGLWWEFPCAHLLPSGSKLVPTLTSLFPFSRTGIVNQVSSNVCWDWWGNPREFFWHLSCTHRGHLSGTPTPQAHPGSQVPTACLPIQEMRLTKQVEGSNTGTGGHFFIHKTTKTMCHKWSEQGAIQSHLHLIWNARWCYKRVYIVNYVELIIKF